jgi:hypothetical protein
MSNRTSRRFATVLWESTRAGLIIGIAQGIVGYFPRADTVTAVAGGALVGVAVAAVLGTALYAIAFRGTNIVAAIRAVASICLITGMGTALFFRWWTHGEGGILSMFVTPAVAVIAAAAVRIYIALAPQTQQESRASS